MAILLFTATPALAQPQNPRPRPQQQQQRQERPQRATGVIPRGVWHNPRTGRDERHSIVVEHRPPAVIARDPHLHRFARGYERRYDWGHFHPRRGAWLQLWGVQSWDAVGTVTCEAANELTGELYPVTAPRDAYWDDDNIDAVLDQALDECAADAGPGRCVPVMPSCTFQNY